MLQRFKSSPVHHFFATMQKMVDAEASVAERVRSLPEGDKRGSLIRRHHHNVLTRKKFYDAVRTWRCECIVKRSLPEGDEQRREHSATTLMC